MIVGMTIRARNFSNIARDSYVGCVLVIHAESMIEGESKMSAIFTKHTSVPYVAKGYVVPAGNRKVVTIAKKDKAGNYGPHLQVTHATNVPVLTTDSINWDHEGVRLACLRFFEDTQWDLIAHRIATGLGKTHADSDIDQAAILEYLNRKTVGDTWDEARIAEWFTDVIAAHVGVKLLQNNADISDADMLVLMKKNQTLVVDALTKSAKAVGVKNAENARIRLALVPEDERDVVWSRFDSKLDKIINPPEAKIADNLGF
jgi:hypothetical protein